jgi:hypothetical protein
MSPLRLDDARRILGDDVIPPDDLAALLGAACAPPSGTLPFTAEELEAAHGAQCLLIYRPEKASGGAPLTLAWLHERHGEAKSAGGRLFRATASWFLSDPFARRETVEEGWALVAKAPWPETLNLTYEQAGEALQRRAAGRPWRRRRAVEAAFDCLAVESLRGLRLLGRAWDWTSTSGTDGGLVNVGGFDENGLDVLSYSLAVKHGALGSCPTVVRR